MQDAETSDYVKCSVAKRHKARRIWLDVLKTGVCESIGRLENCHFLRSLQYRFQFISESAADSEQVFKGAGWKMLETVSPVQSMISVGTATTVVG